MDGIGTPRFHLRRHPQDHLSTVVRDSLNACGMEDTEVFQRRGGPLRKRPARKHIERHNRPENDLLCVGKSYGARNLTRILLKLDSVRYRRTGLLTVDAQWSLQNINHKTFDVPPIDYVYNFYQTGFMGGAMLDKDRAREDGWNREVSATHATIDVHPEVAQTLRRLLINMTR